MAQPRVRNKKKWITWGVAGAVAIFASALAKPQDAIFKRAFVLYQAGSLQDAKALLVKDVSKPPAALNLSLLGTIELQQGELPSAEHHLRQALASNSGLQGARSTLAAVLEQEGKLPEARNALQQLLAADPKNFQALLGLARIANREGNTESALAWALKAKAIAPHDAGVLYDVGALCLQMDLIKDGTENLEQAAQIEPSPAILYALASARVANRDLTEAKKIYEDLLRTQPDEPQLNYALGTTYFLSGDLDAAQTYLERSVAVMPDQVESLYYLGVIADQKGDKEKSAKLLDAVVMRQPKHARAHLALGQLYRSEGKLEQAREQLEVATHLAPDSQKAHYQFGLLLNALKQTNQAKKELEVAQQLRATSDDKVSWRLLPHP